MLALFSLGTPEIVVIGFIALLLFGSRLPNVMRSMGRSVVEFKRGMREVEEEMNKPTPDEGKKEENQTPKQA